MLGLACDSPALCSHMIRLWPMGNWGGSCGKKLPTAHCPSSILLLVQLLGMWMWWLGLCVEALGQGSATHSRTGDSLGPGELSSHEHQGCYLWVSGEKRTSLCFV